MPKGKDYCKARKRSHRSTDSEKDSTTSCKQKRQKAHHIATSESQICVLHIDSTNPGSFQPLTEERLNFFKGIKGRRLKEPINSVNRLPHICAQIPDEVGDNLGYHTNCAKRFTCNLSRLGDSDSNLALRSSYEVSAPYMEEQK